VKTIDASDSKYPEVIVLNHKVLFESVQQNYFFHIINLIFNRDTNNCMHNEQYTKQNEIKKN
jgi:hypothetical protein